MVYTLGMRTINEKIIQKENQLLVKIKFGILTIEEAGKILDDYINSLSIFRIIK